MTLDLPQNCLQPRKRAHCERCQRALRACICACAKTVESPIEVLILQHSAEKGHIKNTAGLLHLCLPNSRLWLAEQFPEELLQIELAHDGKQTLLLYPDDSVTANAEPHFFEMPARLPVNRLRLLMIDATWRKSRQMLNAHPCLQTLPRYALTHVPESKYVIRKARQAHQLSTLEAACYAMMALDTSDKNYTPLLDALEAFNHLQCQFGVHRLQREPRFKMYRDARIYSTKILSEISSKFSVALP